MIANVDFIFLIIRQRVLNVFIFLTSKLLLKRNLFHVNIFTDAEFARSLEQNESNPMKRSNPPNMEEIMEMETAISTYNNNVISLLVLCIIFNDYICKTELERFFLTFISFIYLFYEQGCF